MCAHTHTNCEGKQVNAERWLLTGEGKELQNRDRSPASVARLVGHYPTDGKVTGLIIGQGTYLGC